MNKNKLEFFRKSLIQEKKKIIESINRKNLKEFGMADEYYTEISGYDNHPADIGTEVFMMEQDKGFKNKLNDNIYEIDESLEDIKNGKYGICNNCEKPINEKRLELVPYLKTCIDCSEENKPSKGQMDFSYNSNILDESNIGFDREDTYQEIAWVNIVDGDPSFSTGDNIGIMDDEEGVEEVENISQEDYEKTLE